MKDRQSTLWVCGCPAGGRPRCNPILDPTTATLAFLAGQMCVNEQLVMCIFHKKALRRGLGCCTPTRHGTGRPWYDAVSNQPLWNTPPPHTHMHPPAPRPICASAEPAKKMTNNNLDPRSKFYNPQSAPQKQGFLTHIAPINCIQKELVSVLQRVSQALSLFTGGKGTRCPVSDARCLSRSEPPPPLVRSLWRGPVGGTKQWTLHHSDREWRGGSLGCLAGRRWGCQRRAAEDPNLKMITGSEGHMWGGCAKLSPDRFAAQNLSVPCHRVQTSRLFSGVLGEGSSWAGGGGGLVKSDYNGSRTIRYDVCDGPPSCPLSCFFSVPPAVCPPPCTFSCPLFFILVSSLLLTHWHTKYKTHWHTNTKLIGIQNTKLIGIQKTNRSTLCMCGKMRWGKLPQHQKTSTRQTTHKM